MSALLEVKQLSCERDERVLFSRLDFELHAGHIAQIGGPNGVGKTSFLRTLAGLSGLYHGEILWQGKPARGYDYLSSLLYLGHMPAVNKSLTALENLQWYFGLNGIKAADQPASVIPSNDELEQALCTLGLKGYEDVPCHQMSAGQHRRVALARLFCSKAPLWILDEPFTAIDVKGVALLEKQIKQHAESGGIVILTTHQTLGINGVKLLDLSKYASPSQLVEGDVS